MKELTAEDYARARRLLCRRDPVLAAIIRRYGPCGLANRRHADPFMALAQAIVSQQLSTKAAATIYSRVSALFGEGRAPSAAGVPAITDEAFRAACELLGVFKHAASREAGT